jgi:hypothetical protein
MTTEKEFDEEFDVDRIAQSIVEYHKEQVKKQLGNKKRHKQ